MCLLTCKAVWLSKSYSYFIKHKYPLFVLQKQEVYILFFICPKTMKLFYRK